MSGYVASTELERGADAPGRARGFVRGALTGAGLESPSAELLLLVSELVTNSVVHTRSGVIRLEVDVDPSRIRCAVFDDEPGRSPELRPRARGRVGGLGLRIVDAVALRWGCDDLGATKSVWFELEPPSTARGSGQISPSRS